jgi:hypothetical protein
MGSRITRPFSCLAPSSSASCEADFSCFHALLLRSFFRTLQLLAMLPAPCRETPDTTGVTKHNPIFLMISQRAALFCTFICLCVIPALAFSFYPDQQYVLAIDSLYGRIETNDGLALSPDGKSIMLQADRADGSITLRPQSADYPFNEGLPSWNGTAPADSSAFKIQMRFPYNGGWSGWLTVGYWKSNIWTTYGSTSFGGGYVDVDFVKLSSYVSSWQFRIRMTRTSLAQVSPTLHRLSFVVSDSGTAGAMDFSQILADNPLPVLIPTTFVYQYGVDSEIGGKICSPSSVAMILKSYGIAVDVLTFAQDTYDPYHGIFGVWPRVVQNASEYGVDGTVTRYRTWGQTRDVLAADGRIAMSVGRPLYSGHLMMLAGFNASGTPIVHDPARSNGYSYVFNKSDLSHSWFDKGGVSYTFYLRKTTPAAVAQERDGRTVAGEFALEQNYPNPFNASSVIGYRVSGAGLGRVRLAVYDMLGREVAVLVDEHKESGAYTATWNASGMASGVYIYRLTTNDYTQCRRMVLLK